MVIVSDHVGCIWKFVYIGKHDIDGLVQERHNPSVLALELHLSCTNQSIWFIMSAIMPSYTYTKVKCKIYYLLSNCILMSY